MRFLIVFALLVFVQPAFADDEFGARFGSNSTAGFEDASTDPAKALSEIMPAAGEEADPAVTEDEPASASPQNEEAAEGETQINELR
jgi:hypothetical protein